MIEQVSSIIFVDQPIGTGFSYSTDVRDIRHDEEGVGEDMYDFFQVGDSCSEKFIVVLFALCCMFLWVFWIW
jgi:hypothetical protein